MDEKLYDLHNIMTKTQQPPLSLYIHMPWCIRKCPYCDFNSHQVRGDIPEEKYITTLAADLQSQLPFIQEREIDTIFIGGGTPSLFSPDSYKRLFHEIKKQTPLRKDAEITLEANPGTAEQAKFSGYRAAGINRLSIGVQTLNPTQLKTLGRIHDPKEALSAIDMGHRAGFEEINADIMFGLPNQSQDGAMNDLTQIIEKQPTHISWYQLTLEPNTHFYKHPPTLPDDDFLWELQKSGFELLNAHGFLRYEISAFAKKGHQCQHNLNYWRFGDYIGIGAGAHSKVTFSDKTIRRHSRPKNPKRYMQSTISDFDTVSKIPLNEHLLEFMLNQGRLMEKIPIERLRHRTNLDIRYILDKLTPAFTDDFLTVDQDCITITSKGHRYLNGLLETLL